MNIILYLYGATLLGYTVWRTWDFLTYNLPVAIAGEIALLGVFALDVGLIMWDMAYSHHAKGKHQEQVAIAFVIVDFVGSLGAGVADMVLRQQMINYSIPPMLAKLLIYGIPVIVAGNIGALIFYLISDPSLREKRVKRRIEAEIMQFALDEAEADAQAIANEVKKTIADELKRSAKERVVGRFSAKKVKEVEPIKVESVAINPNGDGAGERVNPTKRQ